MIVFPSDLEEDIGEGTEILPGPSPEAAAEPPTGPGPVVSGEATLIRNAEKFALLSCNALRRLLRAFNGGNAADEAPAVQRAFGKDSWRCFLHAEKLWKQARHLIDPVGTPAECVPDLSLDRFGRICPPVRRQSAHEGAVAAPAELLLVLLSVHPAVKTILSERAAGTNGDYRDSPPLAYPQLLLEHYDLRVVRKLLCGSDPDFYPGLAKQVRTEARAAATLARQECRILFASGGRPTPPTVNADAGGTGPNAAGLPAFGDSPAIKMPDGPVAETDFFWHGNMPYEMPRGKPAKLISLLWSKPHPRAELGEIEDALWPDRVPEYGFPSVKKRVNAFFAKHSLPFLVKKVRNETRIDLVPCDPQSRT